MSSGMCPVISASNDVYALMLSTNSLAHYKQFGILHPVGNECCIMIKHSLNNVISPESQYSKIKHD